MKVNKKLVLSTAAVLGASALATGGTIAYFTDSETRINTFTVGNVKIEMYESQLHRMNSEREGNFSALASDQTYCDWTASQENPAGRGDMVNYDKARYCTPNMPLTKSDTSGLSAVTNRHMTSTFHNVATWGYSDDTIIADAANYKKSVANGDNEDGYFTTVSAGIVPGQWVRKFTYVKNTDGTADYAGSDAYVLIRYMVPIDYADDLELKIPGTPYEVDTLDEDGVQGYFTAVNRDATSGEYSAYVLTANGIDDYTGYTQTIGNVEYKVYAAVTTSVVNPGEMTFWSPVNVIRLKADRQNADPNGEKYVDSSAILNVVVDAQAIQAKTFSDAIDAINHL